MNVPLKNSSWKNSCQVRVHARCHRKEESKDFEHTYTHTHIASQCKRPTASDFQLFVRRLERIALSVCHWHSPIVQKIRRKGRNRIRLYIYIYNFLHPNVLMSYRDIIIRYRTCKLLDWLFKYRANIIKFIFIYFFFFFYEQLISQFELFWNKKPIDVSSQWLDFFFFFLVVHRVQHCFTKRKTWIITIENNIHQANI